MARKWSCPNFASFSNCVTVDRGLKYVVLPGQLAIRGVFRGFEHFLEPQNRLGRTSM